MVHFVCIHFVSGCVEINEDDVQKSSWRALDLNAATSNARSNNTTVWRRFEEGGTFTCIPEGKEELFEKSAEVIASK